MTGPMLACFRSSVAGAIRLLRDRQPLRSSAVPERLKLLGEELVPGAIAIGSESKRGILLDRLVLVNLNVYAAVCLSRVDKAHAKCWHTAGRVAEARSHSARRMQGRRAGR